MGYEALQQIVDVPADSTDFAAQIACSQGKVALGGGYAHRPGSDFTVTDSYPTFNVSVGGSDSAFGWTVLITNPGDSSVSVNLRVICADSTN